jgi:hypothetical protein
MISVAAAASGSRWIASSDAQIHHKLHLIVIDPAGSGGIYVIEKVGGRTLRAED